MNQNIRQSVESMIIDAFNPYSKYTNLPSPSCLTELFKDYPDDMSDIDEANCIKYFKEIVIPHKVHVFNEGLLLMQTTMFQKYQINEDSFLKRLMHHDLSKFSYIEALGYMHKHFKEIDWNAQEFKLAWNHHKHYNDHHCEHWMSINSAGQIDWLEMSTIAIFEMFADWAGAGHTYGETIFDWLPKNIDRYLFNAASADIICDIIENIFPDYLVGTIHHISNNSGWVSMSKK